MDRHIIFINQSPNTMLNDIAGVYKSNQWKTTLICGYTPPLYANFDEIVHFTAYKRSGTLNRFNTWWKFTKETVKYLSNNGKEISRFFMVSNPPFLFYFTKKLKKKHPKSDFHFLIYDLYPNILKEYSKLLSIPFYGPMKYLNKVNFNLADKLFTPSMSLSKAVENYTKNSVETIYNWTDSTSILPVLKSENKFLIENNINSKIIVIYSGNLGITHDVDTIINSTLLIKDPEIDFIFIGEGTGMTQVDNTILKGSENIKRFGWQPDAMFSHSIAAGDVAIVSYKNGMEGYSIPSKLPFYFATGTPVIMIGNPQSELGSIILENKLGWVVPNDQPEELAKLLVQLKSTGFDDYKTRVINFVKENWSLLNAIKFYRN
jgi:glycosyltransferase involved in cell wall biosynthesis